MARSQSSSRSRSRSPRERLDRFGRVIPSGSKRSHSRSHSRDRSRGRYSRRRSRSRSPHRSRRSRSGSRDSRSRRPYDSRRRDLDIPPSNRTNIEDPEFLNARLFIGSLPSDKVTKEELEDLFKGYGKILGVSVHDRGFGFVQFERAEDAVKAKEAENGSKLKGSVLDVKMAAEGRKDSRGRGGRGAPPPRDSYSRDPGGYPPRGPPPGRERSPLRGGDPYDDRYRDPYARREPPPPPPRDGVDRGDARHPPPPPLARDDPYYADPYRRPPPIDDPYREPFRDDPYRRDPYRRDPYDDPYRDPYYRDPYLPPPPPPKKPMPADVQIICMNKQLEQYAEIIDGRLRQAAMISDILVIPEGSTVQQMVEDAARLKFLFAIIVNSQNEAHKSLTLNILHGTPQEHRNMPLDDAMKLMASSFEKYIETQREKTTASAAPGAAAATGGPAGPAGGSVAPFVPPAADISYLLNLLADNRQLTVEEIDKVIAYLKERKDKLLIAEGRRPVAGGASARPAPTGVPAPSAADTTTSSAYLQQQQQELQSKILNILNGSGSGSTHGVAQAAPQAVQAHGGYGAAGVMSTARPTAQPQSVGGANPLINFDNPNVQKALDNLIQSGPSLLKSIPSSVAQQPAPPRQSGQTSLPRQGGYPPQPQQSVAQAQQGYGSQYQQYGAQQMDGHMQAQMSQMSQPQGGYGAQSMGHQQAMGVRAPQQGQGLRPRY